MDKPVRFTVGFIADDEESARRVYSILQGRWSFNSDKAVRVFALSASDMFAEQAVMDAALDSDMDLHELRDFLSLVPCCQDLDALCEEWELER